MDSGGYTDRFIPVADGVRLHVRDYSATERPDGLSLPVICLPGLSRTCRDFHRFARRLSRDPSGARRVITLDYRGRGQSDWATDKSSYQLPVEAQDVVSICNAMEVSRADFIGTSRGGLILHLLAATHPALLRGIVLNDIGPVIETSGLITIRDTLSARATFRDWAEAAQALKRLYGSQFSILTDADWSDMAQALFRVEDRRIVPDFDPALLAPLQSLHPQAILPDLWDLFDHLRSKPVLAIRAEHSTILSVATFNAMADRHPALARVTAAQQGHAPLLHLAPVYADIRSFLEALPD